MLASAPLLHFYHPLPKLFNTPDTFQIHALAPMFTVHGGFTLEQFRFPSL